MNAEFILVARLLLLAVLWATILLFRNRALGKDDMLANMAWVLLLFSLINVFSGIEYRGVEQIWGEAALLVLTVASLAGFRLGVGKARRTPQYRHSAANYRKAILPPHASLVAVTFGIFVLFVYKLTGGNFLIALTSGVELKHMRLQLINIDKDATLLLLESLTISLLTLLAIWTTLTLKISKHKFYATLAMVVAYILSTGARSPLVSLLVVYILTLLYAQRDNPGARKLVRFLRRYSIVMLSIVFVYLSVTTSVRMEYEGLADTVFVEYFNVSSLGYASVFLESGNSVLFTLGTIIVYISSTVTNMGLRVQEAVNITHTYGYQLYFPYVNLMETIFSTQFDSVRSLSQHNSGVLLNYSYSATQWSTIYGDIIWDFGLIGSPFVVFLLSFSLGRIVMFSRRKEAAPSLLLKIYIYSWLAVPLVSPFGSLQFHITLVIIFTLYILQRLTLLSHSHAKCHAAGMQSTTLPQLIK